MSQRPPGMLSGPIVGIVALFCIFIGAPLAGTGHGVDLIAIAVVAILGFVFWRPLQAWAARLEAGQAPVNTAAFEQRLQHLEALLDAMSKQQMQLQETVRWQAQLLEHSKATPQAPGRE